MCEGGGGGVAMLGRGQGLWAWVGVVVLTGGEVRVGVKGGGHMLVPKTVAEGCTKKRPHVEQW